MAVLTSVTAALEGVAVPAWRRDIALALASAMDESPNASTAKELRTLMAELVDAPAVKGDVSDDLASKRAARRAAASS